MYWNWNSTSSSQIDSVLAKEDVTLQELMDEHHIISECKLQNKTLMDFLTRPDVIEELVTLTTVEPSTELDERTRFKYSNIACEILTCDVPALNEKLAGDENLLSKLYVFLDSDPPLNPLLASFFSKIMGVLIAKKTEQVLDFLKAKDNFVPILLKHLGTSAIMDLTLKLMTQVGGAEVKQNILNWLDSQRLMENLVSLLNPKIDRERHDNVSQLLCDFIKTSRENERSCNTESGDTDLLLNKLESPEIISLLLDNMLENTKTESCIVGGIQVLLAILDVNKSSFDETNEIEKKQFMGENTIVAILNRLEDFHNLLLEPPKKPPVVTTIGVLDPPFGNTRLQLIRLFAALIATNNRAAMQKLISLGTMQVLLDLFFKFPWNNFLHTQVQACIVSALKGADVTSDVDGDNALYKHGAQVPSEVDEDNALYKHLLVNCKLIERILDAWKDNEAQQQETKGIRKGYMGHLTNIAISIAELCSSSKLGEFLKENLPQDLESFNNFNENTLRGVQETLELQLGGGTHLNISSKDGDEYSDIPFSQSSVLNHQMYTQYQLHQITPHSIESYGFNDDTFNDGEDTLQTIDHRTGMNFDLSEGDLVQQHEYFKQLCAQNINTLDDVDDQIFEDRDHTFQTVIEKQGERHDAVYSSDSDEDDASPPEDPFMENDPWMCNNKESESAVAPISVSDPWASKEKTASEANAGWANFNAFANFESPAISQDKIYSPYNQEVKVEKADMNRIVKTLSSELAQIVNEVMSERLGMNNKGVAAGGDQASVPPNDSVQLSKNTENVENDTCQLQTGPSTTEKARPEPDQQV